MGGAAPTTVRSRKWISMQEKIHHNFLLPRRRRYAPPTKWVFTITYHPVLTAGLLVPECVGGVWVFTLFKA